MVGQGLNPPLQNVIILALTRGSYVSPELFKNTTDDKHYISLVKPHGAVVLPSVFTVFP